VTYQGPREAGFERNGAGEHVYAQFVSGNTFGLLGVRPAVGRLIVPSDDVAGNPRLVAVLSHSFWMRRFGGDARTIGRVFLLGQTRYEIVGVAGEGFTGVEPGIRTDVWVPITSTPNPESLSSPGWQWFRVMGRLAAGETVSGAGATLQAVFTNWRRERVKLFPNAPRALRERYVSTPIYVRPAANGISDLRRDFERPLWILATVAGLVLLLACSNLANLMLARAAAREREMALRISIGAGRWRLVQQLLVEAAVISVAAAVLGSWFARASAPLLVGMLAPRETPAYLDFRFDWRALAFVTAIGALATLMVGLLPALRASAIAPIKALKASGGRHTSRLALLRPLIGTQIAFSLTVLFLASLLIASFERLSHVDLGFHPEQVGLVDLTPVAPNAPAHDRDAALHVLERVRALPGVAAAAQSSWPLMSGSGWSSAVWLPGGRWDGVEVSLLEVSPGFIETMRIPLRAGRDLSRADIYDGSPSVLVNETFARKYFPGVSPLGRQFIRPERRNEKTPEIQRVHEVVGLVADAKYNSVRNAAPPTVYVPPRALRSGDTVRDATLEIRSSMSLEAVTDAVRAVVRELAPELKVTGSTLESTLVTNTMLRERLLAVLSGFFALISLALAGVGLYGVLSYSVVQQTREIGIRVALGAAQRAVVAGVLRGVAAYVVLGIAAGLAAGLWLAQFVEKLLYEVQSRDMVSVALPIGELLLIAASAALLPARRAARVDPIVALRDE
jgi:predicted permease